MPGCIQPSSNDDPTSGTAELGTVCSTSGRLACTSRASERKTASCDSGVHPRWTTRARLRRRIAALERERTKLRQANAALAAHDPVSGLPRFPFFARDLAAAIAAAAAAGGRIVLLYLDLDNLHLVNQTRGQDAGDQVLRSLAARLGGLAADRGLLAHVASDEFVLALADDGSTDQVELGERVRRLCEEPIELDGEPLFVTASIGVSCFPDQAATSQELLREAEAAMQQAKQVGRNAVRAFTRAQRQDLEERLLLGLSLREALRKQQFVVLYQPQISTRDWRISGLTARIRWHNPKLGPLPAERFLPIAAELGLSIEIDDFLLDQACRQIRALHDEGLEHFVVSVEISAPRLRRPNFVDTVRTMLSRRRAAARCLELALSEPTAADVLHALRMLGVRLALDDFGSRWSELRRLGHCPIERLRLDPRLLHDLCTDSATAAVCRALINLGHRFGMSVLADGVDTAAQVGPLLRYECDALQGSYFGAPVSAERARAPDPSRILPVWVVTQQELAHAAAAR
jgi:diguanylate cyclase (GGDEF)-like protein